MFTTPDGYRIRFKALRVLEFATYFDYLNSTLWRRIRNRVFKRDSHSCRKCGIAKADSVHHTDYSLSTLRGESIDELYSVCEPCHEELEFDGDIKKTWQQVIAFDSWLPIKNKNQKPIRTEEQKEARRQLKEKRKADKEARKIMKKSKPRKLSEKEELRKRIEQVKKDLMKESRRFN